ncbi:conserved hypothetical protein [Methanospirillum hungatei JF-1]|nr:conserved hypothetical protein [Methanospirillum hungatei JF-1]
MNSFSDGSSPYTRGTLRSASKCFNRLRFIPIHTGNSICLMGLIPLPLVHPHTHGELSAFPCLLIAESGSSPYTRGTLLGFSDGSIRIRFIPIHTGNSMQKER